MKSLAKNSFFYLLYEVLNVLFPLITGIYVARVLLPESIGEVAYAQNIVQYFVILSYLGIPTYGMREVAKYRDDKEKLNKLYSELYLINLFSTIFFLLIYIGLVAFTPSFRSNLALYSIVGLQIALNALNITWLFTGLEEFQFISIRNIVFKGLNLLLLVLLVKKPDDALIYAAITVVGTAGNYLINILYAPRFISFTIKGLSFKQHMRSIMYLVAVNFAIEIYTLVDVTMLGNMCEKTNVAYYSYGSKIYKILLQVMNTFTMVVVPRLSYYYKKEEMKQFNVLVTKTLKVIFLLACPMIVGLLFTANTITTVLYGAQYFNSGRVLQMLSFMLLISPIGYLLGSRMLLISKRENKMLVSVSVGAFVNIICNYILIQRFAEFGAAAASVISEIVVMILYVNLGRTVYRLNNMWQSIIKIGIAVLSMAVVLFVVTKAMRTGIISLIVCVIAAAVTYFVCLFVEKEEVVYSYGITLLRKVRLIR